MTGSAAIDFLIVLGIVCIVIVVVIKVLQSMGVAIPQVVWIIAGGIIGIICLIWLGKMLPALLP
jgi:hypothetical protein